MDAAVGSRALNALIALGAHDDLVGVIGIAVEAGVDEGGIRDGVQLGDDPFGIAAATQYLVGAEARAAVGRPDKGSAGGLRVKFGA